MELRLDAQVSGPKVGTGRLSLRCYVQELEGGHRLVKSSGMLECPEDYMNAPLVNYTYLPQYVTDENEFKTYLLTTLIPSLIQRWGLELGTSSLSECIVK